MTKFLDDRLGEIFKTPKQREEERKYKEEYDAFFIQALKDFESLGFIEIKKDGTGIEILDRKALENYLKDFGKL
jgi:hypothetical protein|tara:strand:+ start:567 stop:788 length:222 start_codon:yes stop_codon:yes gene_type:complete